MMTGLSRRPRRGDERYAIAGSRLATRPRRITSLPGEVSALADRRPPGRWVPFRCRTIKSCHVRVASARFNGENAAAFTFPARSYAKVLGQAN
jgi:hypothetical protein